MRTLGTAVAVVVGLAWTASAQAATLTVGTGQQYATIQEAVTAAQPGDVVEVMGNETYHGIVWPRSENGGQPGNPVTVRGIAVDGHLPIITGIGTGEWENIVVLLNASHYVFEGFEILGDGNPDNYCVVHKADDVVVRNIIVHGCAAQGLMGTDSESGSLTLEYSEFYGNGNDMYGHQIYMATDEETYPGSVFRMQYCYVHDGTGGNNVKSRAQRNEIYYNWIEAAVYHELDLIGPDGADPNLAREDSDVVGNVLIKTSEWRIARIGGDGTGNTSGRYRFANNTMVLSAQSEVAIGMQETVETLEMYNNAIVAPSGSGFRMVNHAEPSGPTPVMMGANNWATAGMGDIPTEWTGTITGSDPGLTNAAAYDYRPLSGSPLVDVGTADPQNAAGMPSPLVVAGYHPPTRRLIPVGSAEARSVAGTIDIGAFETTAGTSPGGAGGSPGTGGSATGGAGPSNGGSPGNGGNAGSGHAGSGGAPGVGGSTVGTDGGVTANGSEDDGGCGCRMAGSASGAGGLSAAFVAMAGLMIRRRRRHGVRESSTGRGRLAPIGE